MWINLNNIQFQYNAKVVLRSDSRYVSSNIVLKTGLLIAKHFVKDHIWKTHSEFLEGKTYKIGISLN